MNILTFSKLVQLGGSKIAKLLPATITVDGEPKFIICKEEDVIVIGDHHIRVRNMLKAMDKKARAGMPKPTRITEAQSGIIMPV